MPLEIAEQFQGLSPGNPLDFLGQNDPPLNIGGQANQN
jgi:hypothetical protein